MRRYTSIPFSFRFILCLRLRFMDTLRIIDSPSSGTRLPLRERVLWTHDSRRAIARFGHTIRVERTHALRTALEVGPSGVEPASQRMARRLRRRSLPGDEPRTLKRRKPPRFHRAASRGKTLKNTPVTAPSRACRPRRDNEHNLARFRSRETSVEWIASSSALTGLP